MQTPLVEAAGEIAHHPLGAIGHPDAAGGEIGIGADHQIHEEVGIEDPFPTAAVRGREADLAHRRAVAGLVGVDVDRGVFHTEWILTAPLEAHVTSSLDLAYID